MTQALVCSLDNAVRGCKIIHGCKYSGTTSSSRLSSTALWSKQAKVAEGQLFPLEEATRPQLWRRLPNTLPPQGSAVCLCVHSSYVTDDWPECMATGGFPPGQARTTRGVQGVRPLGSGPSHLCKHSIQPFQRGPAKEPDVDPLLSLSVLMLGAGVGGRQKARR